MTCAKTRSRWRCAPRAWDRASDRAGGSPKVTRVAMEATGVYTMPVCHALLEHGRFAQVLVCNPAHVKNVPGRKTDAVDAAWLAELLECGLLRGSYLPEPEIKAVRDVARYRKQLVGQRASELQRPGGVLQDAGITLDSVASSIGAVSGRAMIEALIGGDGVGRCWRNWRAGGCG